jgi:hypothetical protein
MQTKKINTSEMDILIKNNIQMSGVEKIDITKKVMAQIDEYESKKIKKYFHTEVIISCIAIISSIFSIFILDKIIDDYKYILSLYNLNFLIIKLIIQGFFGFIALSLTTAIILNKKFKLIILHQLINLTFFS